MGDLRKMFVMHFLFGGMGALCVLIGLIMFVMKLAEVGMMVEASWSAVAGVGLAGLALIVVDVVVVFGRMFREGD